MQHSVVIDKSKCREFAEILQETLVLYLDPFTNPLLYPETTRDTEEQLRYFFFIVAIDHRTSGTTKFEGVIQGKYFHGADLLYRLAKLKLEEDPDFFSPEKLVKISTQDVVKWLSIKYENKIITVKDPEVRAYLLRDAACKLIEYYSGEVKELLKASKGYVGVENYGLTHLLKFFKAYEDPVEKKTFLLIKFLERRGLLTILDPENLHVPVDNHLTRIALRVGLVKILDEALLEEILHRRYLTIEQDCLLRFKVREAYDIVCSYLGISPLHLDDFLWSFGRSCCTSENPSCTQRCSYENCKVKEVGLLCTGTCPFTKICEAYTTGTYIMDYTCDTWYY